MKSTLAPALTLAEQQNLQEQSQLLAAAQQWDEAAKTLRRVALAQPENVELWLQIMRWQREARDFKAAAQTLRRALKSRAKIARQLRTSSTRNTQESDEIAAHDHKLQRETEMLWQSLAETFAEAQDWAECATACRFLLQIAPHHHAAREILATALLHLERTADAENQIRELLVLSPRDPIHRLKLATLLQMQGKSGDALREFERVALAYPNAPFASEAAEAIELLDNLQLQQLLMRAAETPVFRQEMQNSLDETLRENGFYLTDEGRESLRHMMSDGRPPEAARPPRIH